MIMNDSAIVARRRAERSPQYTNKRLSTRGRRHREKKEGSSEDQLEEVFCLNTQLALVTHAHGNTESNILFARKQRGALHTSAD